MNETDKNLEKDHSERIYEILVEIDGQPDTVIIRAPHPEEAARLCQEQHPQALVLCVVRQ
jgi:ABC-type lipoprotein export system ATPase subunit